MLNFIIGRACSGKTYKILSEAANASLEKKVIIIVPEQMTFETERASLQFNVENRENFVVLSFSRLYDFVLEETERASFPCISDFEKTMLTAKAVRACADNLEVFSKFQNNRDFISKIAEIICDFKFSGASREDIVNAANEIGGSCGAKLRDVALIMSVYDALLTNKFVDPSDKLTRLNDILGDFKYFNNTSVYFDAFSGFTGQQYKIITKILEQSDNVTFSFCTNDPNSLDLGIFYNVNTAISRIKNIAKSRDVITGSTICLENNFYSNTTMSAIEEYFVTGNSKNNIDGDYFKVISCLTPRDEALAAANIISKEVADNGYRFKDFVVVSRNPESYGNYMERFCRNNEIALFMDKSVILAETLLSKFIVTLMETASSFTSENILKLLKTNLTFMDADAISELENYTFIWDIKPADWHNEWQFSVNGLGSENDSERDLNKLRGINENREKIIEILSEFKLKFFGSPKNRISAIYECINKLDTRNKLLSFTKQLELQGDSYYSSILRQSWDSLVCVFNSIVKVFDDFDIDNKEFIDAFLIATENEKISTIPQMLDEATFGGADRIRPSKPKVSIILGANQGVFPASGAKSGFFAPSDVEKIKKCGIDLDDDIIKGATEENYIVYSLMCCPTDKVYVLFSNNGMSGETLEISNFILNLFEHFKSADVTEFSFTAEGEFVPRTTKDAFNNLNKLNDLDYSVVVETLREYDDYCYRLDFLKYNSAENNFAITPEDASMLFGKNINISASKFDTYHRCTLSFLLRYGFRVSKLQKADLNVLQRGTIVHYVLEHLIELYREKLSSLTPAMISNEVDRLIGEYISAISGGENLMTPRFAYLLERISKSVKEIAHHLAEEFSQSEFVPKFCELSIGDGGDIPKVEYILDDGSKAFLGGKIDRVDVFENNVRVVDYKTGRKTFALSDTLVGLNLQMLLYLRAFIKNGNELISEPKPAGVLYMPAVTFGDNVSYRMSGLISDSDEIVSAMEKDNMGRFVPKKTERSNDYIPAETFDLVFNKIDSLIMEMGKSIKNGRFDANPTDSKNIDACKYCDFATICRSSNKPHRTVPNYSKDEVTEILKAGDSRGI